MTPRSWRERIKVYWDARDWWIGAYRAEGRTYFCPIPCLVIMWMHR
jgi:hypothetical protein